METLEKLKEASKLLKEVKQEIENMDVAEKTGDDEEILNPVLEKNLWEINNVKTVFGEVEESLGSLEEAGKEKTIEFLNDHKKMKKFESELLELSFTTKRYLKVTGIVDDKFMQIKKEPNTKAIRAYEEATDKLPEGIIEDVRTYPKFKNIKTYEEVEA